MTTNLRPSSDPPGALQPVGTPSPIASGAWRILCSLHDGRPVLYRGAELQIDGIDITIPDEPRCALPGPDGSLTVMLPAGVVTVEFIDGAYSCSPLAPLASPLTLTCADRPAIGIYNSGIATASYSRDSRKLNAADTRALSAAIIADYRKLCAKALETNALIQPVIGFYRLRDRRGRVIYTSSPTLLGPSCGVNCSSPIEAPMNRDTMSGIGPFGLSATPYSIFLRLNSPAPSPLLAAAAKAEILLTPQIHPVDASALAESRIADSSSAAQVAFALPGATIALEPAHGAASKAEAIMARIDAVAKPVAAVLFSPSTFHAHSNTAGFQLPYHLDFEQENAAIAAACRAPMPDADADAADSLKSFCRAPHSFSAARAASVAGAPVWADISPLIFDGYTPAELARDATSRPDGAAVSLVYTPAGDILCSSSSGDSALTPDSLSPILCYPHPSASRILVCIKDADGQWRRIERELHAPPGSRYAYSIAPDLCPISIAEAPAGQPPADSPVKVPRRAPGAIVAADMLDPLNPVGAAIPSAAPITALLNAPRSSAGWNFSHSRMYMFSLSGSYALSLSGAKHPGAPILLDPRPVSGAAVAASLAIAVAGSDLIAIDSAKPSTIADGVVAAGYCHPARETWALMADGSLRVYPDGASDYYLRDIPGITSFHTAPEALYATLADGSLIDCSAESYPSLIPIRYETSLSNPYTTPPRLSIDFAASDLHGSVEVRVHHGAGAESSALITRLSLNGPVNAPILIPLPSVRSPLPSPLTPDPRAAPTPILFVSLSLQVSPDFRLRSISLCSKT